MLSELDAGLIKFGAVPVPARARPLGGIFASLFLIFLYTFMLSFGKEVLRAASSARLSEGIVRDQRAMPSVRCLKKCLQLFHWI